MLSYFYNYTGMEQINRICKALNELKKRLVNENYDNPKKEYDLSLKLFEEIAKIAIERKNEKLANAQYVFRNYFLMFSNLMSYFLLLNEKKYKESWDKLQDCIDDAQCVGKFSENRFDIPDILELLRQYEKLYPYKLFASGEYIITKSHCSICGKSMQSLQCQHIKGNIYWGEPAIECVDEIKEIQAICIVSNPENKRCILESANDERDEIDRFKKLDLYLQLGLPRLQKFSIKSMLENRIKEKNKINRNDKCPCGSNLKYKKCCGKELYYQHEKNVVIPEDIIVLYFKKI